MSLAKGLKSLPYRSCEFRTTQRGRDSRFFGYALNIIGLRSDYPGSWLGFDFIRESQVL